MVFNVCTEIFALNVHGWMQLETGVGGRVYTCSRVGPCSSSYFLEEGFWVPR